MTIASLASDGVSLDLLGRVVSLTLFYAALCWLPLRGTIAVVGRVQALKRRRRKSRPPEPEPQPQQVEDIWIIQ
ncbi:MAG: hypothetical protein ACYSU7_11595 [Planctomycetota bacterium]|jgi:hypothetical protein